MRMSDALLPEFDHEMANTRKTLERVPEDKLGWKPHEKSMTMGRLAGHIAELAGWGKTTIETDSLNLTIREGLHPLQLCQFDGQSDGGREPHPQSFAQVARFAGGQPLTKTQHLGRKDPVLVHREVWRAETPNS